MTSWIFKTLQANNSSNYFYTTNILMGFPSWTWIESLEFVLVPYLGGVDACSLLSRKSHTPHIHKMSSRSVHHPFPTAMSCFLRILQKQEAETPWIFIYRPLSLWGKTNLSSLKWDFLQVFWPSNWIMRIQNHPWFHLELVIGEQSGWCRTEWR